MFAEIFTINKVRYIVIAIGIKTTAPAKKLLRIRTINDFLTLDLFISDN